MKKIMFFRSLFYIGGTEKAILNLLKKLKGFEFYIGYTDDSSDKETLDEFSKYAKVVNIKKEKIEKMDVVVACSLHYHLIKEFSDVKTDKIILWLHHLINFSNSAIMDENEYNKIDKIVVVSKTISNKLESMLPKVKDKLITVYNVIDSLEIIKKSLEPINLNLSKQLNLVTVSRVCEAKGFQRMLILSKALKKADVKFKWFIIGDNYYQDESKQIKERFSEFKDNFEWLGFLSNPHNIVKQCDYSVLLSDEETWGLVLTEAMILGVPCIVSDFEVAYEQVKDKENGIILSKENTESYEDRVIDIINNKDKYKKAVNDFEYRNEVIIEQWESLLYEK